VLQNCNSFSVMKCVEILEFPFGLLCVSAWVGDEVRGASPGLLRVSACELNFSLVY